MKKTPEHPEQIAVTIQALEMDLDEAKKELVQKFPILFVESLAGIGLPEVMLFVLRVDSPLLLAEVVARIKETYPRRIWAEENKPYKELNKDGLKLF